MLKAPEAGTATRRSWTAAVIRKCPRGAYLRVTAAAGGDVSLGPEPGGRAGSSPRMRYLRPDGKLGRPKNTTSGKVPPRSASGSPTPPDWDTPAAGALACSRYVCCGPCGSCSDRGPGRPDWWGFEEAGRAACCCRRGLGPRVHVFRGPAARCVRRCLRSDRSLPVGPSW